MILVNILKHAFVEEWLPKVILTYTNNVRSFSTLASGVQHKPSMNTLGVMNNDDVNRWFSWAVLKSKRNILDLLKLEL